MSRWFLFALAVTFALGCGATANSHGNSGAHGEFPTGMDPDVERVAADWVSERAGVGFTIVPLATLHCLDGSRIALVWPAMRGGEVIDDDVVALRIASEESGLRVVEDWRARDHDSLRAVCGGARIERGASGLPAERIGDELILRSREVREAIAAHDGARFRRACILFSQLFEDRLVASEGMPDALTDTATEEFELVRAEVVGDQITIHYLRRGSPRRETARLVPATGSQGLVVIQVQ